MCFSCGAIGSQTTEVYVIWNTIELGRSVKTIHFFIPVLTGTSSWDVGAITSRAADSHKVLWAHPSTYVTAAFGDV